VITEATREDRTPAAGGRPPGRWRRWLLAFAVAGLLAGMAAAMITTAVAQTPTIDEPVYVGAATFSLEHHSLRFNPEHPPLGKLIIATGLAFADVHVDAGFAGDQTELGRFVLYESGHDPGRLMLLARLPVIVLTLLFGLVVFAFARDLAGPAGGVVALALYALSPDLVAHGSLATLDVPVAGFLVTSAWLLWRARRRPVRYLPLAGLALGAAVATKMSALAAVPVVLLLVVLSVWQDRSASGPQRTLRRLGAGAAAALGVALIAVAVVWVSYLVVDPRLRWVPPPGLPPLEGLRSLAGLLPLPAPYLDGLRVQFGFEDQVWTTFLFGSRHVGALWYYLPAALLVKTPLGTLALWAAGVGTMVAVPKLRPAAPYVLVPAAVLLAAAMTGSRDLGVRYALFVPMFLAVAAAGVVALRRRWARVAVAGLVAFTAVSSLEQRYPGQRVWLVYKGSGVPSYYGIDAADPLAVPPDAVHGLLVVSDSATAKADDRLGLLLRTSTPIDEVGHSITIHRRP
jgi:hypothetical protein